MDGQVAVRAGGGCLVRLAEQLSCGAPHSVLLGSLQLLLLHPGPTCRLSPPSHGHVTPESPAPQPLSGVSRL